MPRGTEGLTLGDKQRLFCRLLGQLLAFIYAHPSWAVTLGEGYVGDTDGKDKDYDGPHLAGGAHYNRLGQDLNLFVQGTWVTGSHPAWDEIGQVWLGLHPFCRWGGEFHTKDWNHFSLLHDGRA